MRKSFGGICRTSHENEDCLSLLTDVSALSGADKLGVALGLSLGPLKSSIAKAVEDTLAPQLFYTVIATGLVTWAVLATNPEPVFTKAAAIISAILLIYLGVDTFLTVLEASRELKRAAEKAISAGELAQAGQHFANRVGPEVARVFVLAVTVVVSQGMAGGAASLASRLSRMPGYPDASVVGATRVGIELAHVGQVSSVAIAGNTIVVSLPATAVAMVARNGAGANSNPGGPRSWGSFSGLKRALGPAEDGKQWHHIIEQTPGNVNRFGPEAIHNTENVLQLDQGLHKRLSGFYSSIQQEITGSRILTVRQWLSTQSFEAQRDFGLQAIEKVQKRIWGVWK
ncbi:putative lipoprotein [Corallococcus coralloides]|uniref:Putative lipoprotein n=2 Tax=Corallococcus coralloides TaxID=184914 RepID=A0A410RU66_CORCK|nr:putative lipoprotein [Corallococcus coralloides]